MKYTFLAVASILFLASCSKKGNKQGKYIPKDATAVIVVDFNAMSEKLKKGNLDGESFLKKIKLDSSQPKDKAKFIAFKDSSGIDWTEKLYLFLVQKGSMKAGNSVCFNGMASLKDSAKFGTYLRSQKDIMEDREITKEKNYSYVLLSSSSLVAWNDEVVVVSGYEKDAKYEIDSTGFKPVDKSKFKDELKKEIDRYFNLKSDEAVTSVDVYNKMFEKKADGYLFGTSAGTMALLSATPFNLPKVQDLLKDTYSTCTFNFEDGKVVGEGYNYPNALLGSILKKYAGPVVNTDQIGKLPATSVNGVMLASFNPELFSGILKEIEIAPLLDGFLNKEGLTSADIFKCLKGEINVLMGDFGITTQPRTMDMGNGQSFQTNMPTPTAKLIIAAAIGDKVAFDKIMELLAKQGFVVKEGTTYKAGPQLAAANLYLTVDDKNFILASDEATYKAYAAGTGKATIATDVMSKIKGKSTAAFIDFNSIVNGCAPVMTDPYTQKIGAFFNETFKDAIITGDNFDGKSIKSEFVLRMKDEKQNSLVSIGNFSVNVINLFQEMFSPKRYEQMATPEQVMPSKP